MALLANFWSSYICLQNNAGQRRFELVQIAWKCYQIVHPVLYLMISENAKIAKAIFEKSQTSIFSQMIENSLLNGKVSLISSKLYLGVGLKHF